MLITYLSQFKITRERRMLVFLLLLIPIFSIIMFLPPTGPWAPVRYNAPLAAAIASALIIVGVIALPQPPGSEPWKIQERLGWAFIAIGLCVWSIGEGIWQYKLATGQYSFPSAADIGYIGLEPLLLLGFFFFPTHYRNARQWLLLVLDSLIATGALICIIWALFLEELTRHLTTDSLTNMLIIYYPTADMLLLSCIVLLFLRDRNQVSYYRDPARKISLFLLGIGMSGVALANLSFYMQKKTSMFVPSLVDIGWPVGMLMMSLGAYLRSSLPAGSLAEPPPSLSPGNIWTRIAQVLPYTLVVILFAILIYRVLNSIIIDNGLLSVLLFSIFGVILLVMVRQVLTIQENIRLVDQQALALEQLSWAKQQIESQSKDTTQRNEELIHGIEHLKSVHARLANGHWWTRSTLARGELVPLSTSLNVMAQRFQYLEQTRVYAEKASIALDDLIASLENYQAGAHFIASSRSRELLQFRYLLFLLESLFEKQQQQQSSERLLDRSTEPIPGTVSEEPSQENSEHTEATQTKE